MQVPHLRLSLLRVEAGAAHGRGRNAPPRCAGSQAANGARLEIWLAQASGSSNLPPRVLGSPTPPDVDALTAAAVAAGP